MECGGKRSATPLWIVCFIRPGYSKPCSTLRSVGVLNMDCDYKTSSVIIGLSAASRALVIFNGPVPGVPLCSIAGTWYKKICKARGAADRGQIVRNDLRCSIISASLIDEANMSDS